MNSKLFDVFNISFIFVLLVNVKISFEDINDYYGEESENSRYKVSSSFNLYLQISVFSKLLKSNFCNIDLNFYFSCDREEVESKCGMAKKFENIRSSKTDSEYAGFIEEKGKLIKILTFQLIQINLADTYLSRQLSKLSRLS